MNFFEGSSLSKIMMDRKSSGRRHPNFIVVFSLLSSLVFSNIALAEDLTVDLNTEQRKLNNEAISALSSNPPKPEVAIQLMQAALLMGTKGNVLYLTLGRAYQLSGQCKDADSAYQQAWQAPRVEGVPQADVIERIERYREEMSTSCTGTLVIHCSNPNTDLIVDNKNVVCNEPFELMPGEYPVKAYLGSSQTTELSVKIHSMEQTRIQIVLGGGAVETAATAEKLSAQEIVAFAFTEAENAQLRANKRMEADRIAAEKTRLENERKRLEEERLALERDMLSEEQQQIAAERRRLEERRERAARGDQDALDEIAAGTTKSKRPKNSKLDMSDDNEIRGWYGQAYLGVPVGGYLVQVRDGFMGGGLSFGGTGSFSLGYAFSHLIGIEGYGKVDYLGSNAIPFKDLSSRKDDKDQAIALDSWRFLGEMRAWLGFVSPGFFVERRTQFLDFDVTGVYDSVLIGGPAFSISTAGMFRGDGYVMFTGRWAPVFDGDFDIFSLGISAASGYADFSFEYSRLTGEDKGKTPLKAGEQLLFNLGFRIPFSF